MMKARSAIVMLALATALPMAGPAMADVLGKMAPPPALSEARIATLPAAEQPAWRDYLKRSQAQMVADKAALMAERAGGTLPVPPKRDYKSGGAGMPLDKPAEWYAGAEARAVADNIVSFQTPAGGWGKNQNRATPPRVKGESWAPPEQVPGFAKADIQSQSIDWSFVGTIDNEATTSEIRFLARVQAAVPGAAGEPYRAALLKGVRYLLAAEYPNGGWPQVYPLQGSYHDALTYNDGALSEVATLLADVAARKGAYGFVPADLAQASGAAVARAVQLVLDTQLVVDGKRTLWGQQHDVLTRAPVGARNFEPSALSSTESAQLLVFLMQQPDPSPALRAAVRDGVAWLEAHALRDVEWATTPEGRKLMPKPGAGPIWSRYYDLKTGKPIFGDRDRSIHDDVNEISRERRDGYSWFSTAPASAIKRYAGWRAKTGG